MLLLLPQGTPGTIAVGVSDTASLQADEGNTSDFDVQTVETARVVLSDISQVSVRVDRADFAGLLLSDVSGIAITNPTAIAGIDTASLSLSEASALAVTIAVTDTASLSLGESSAVDVNLTEIDGTDSVGISVADFAFSSAVPEVARDAGDAVTIYIDDGATIAEIMPVALIRFEPRPDVICFSSP